MLPRTETAFSGQQASAPASIGDRITSQHEDLSISQGGSKSAANAVDMSMASSALQLLRLIRNLCAAGAAAADPLTAGGVPAQVAQLVVELDPQAAGGLCNGQHAGPTSK